MFKPVIEIDAYERECDHNTVIRNTSMSGILIKDYRIRIDGEARAWFISRRPQQRGYDMWDIDRRKRISLWSYVESKEDFRSKILDLLEQALIPTRDPARAARERENALRIDQQKKVELKERHRERTTEDAIEDRSGEMFSLLKRLKSGECSCEEIKNLAEKIVDEITQDADKRFEELQKRGY